MRVRECETKSEREREKEREWNLGEGDGCLEDLEEDDTRGCVESLKDNYYVDGVKENDECSREEDDECPYVVLLRKL